MNTNKLKVMKFDESMENYEDRWTKAVDEEHEFMLENIVWHPMKVNDVPIGAKILTSTWVCKQKTNSVKQARMNGQGYKQVDGVHYDILFMKSLVTKKLSVRIVFVLGIMACWKGSYLYCTQGILKG